MDSKITHINMFSISIHDPLVYIISKTKGIVFYTEISNNLQFVFVEDLTEDTFLISCV
jgi:hypothetical protein